MTGSKRWSSPTDLSSKPLYPTLTIDSPTGGRSRAAGRCRCFGGRVDSVSERGPQELEHSGLTRGH